MDYVSFKTTDFLYFSVFTEEFETYLKNHNHIMILTKIVLYSDHCLQIVCLFQYSFCLLTSSEDLIAYIILKILIVRNQLNQEAFIRIEFKFVS